MATTFEIQSAELRQAAQIELRLALKETELPINRASIDRALRHATLAQAKLNSLEVLNRIGSMPKTGE